MPCLKAPAPPVPSLPSPLTLGPPIPDVNFDPSLCCKIPLPDVPLPPIPMPPLVFNPAVVAVINSNLAALNAYFDQLAIECPLE